MRISLNTNQWFDGEGNPLSAGRISVYVHGSDVHKDIFTLDGDGTYTQATNPLILDDAGRAPTVWFDASTVDVKVEAYNGVPGSYDQVDTYQDGFDFPDAKNDTVAYGISGLQAINPEVGTVTVVGFNSSSDCGPRSFVWDPSCTASEDGCTIVSSDVDPDGRWILVSDERYMPSSWFGIVPGSDESNVAALLTYQDTVGQWNIRMPPVPRFKAGDYTVSSGSFSTTKVLAFDPGAKFTGASFTCPAAEITHNVSYVADFEFTGKTSEAHSSWFRTADGFWHCDARYMYIDSSDYMTDHSLTYNATLSKCNLYAQAQIPTVYSNGACIRLENVVVEGKPFRMASDYVVLTGTEYGDRIFTGSASSWDPGLVSAGHRQQFASQPDINSFASARLWYETMKERRDRAPLITTDTLDFEDRQMGGTVDMGTFAVLRNVRTDSVRVSAQYCTLENVKADVYVDSTNSNTNLLVNDSEVQLYSWDGLVNLGGNRSNVSIMGNTGIDPTDCAITWNGGNFQGKIWISDANAENYAKANLVSFNQVNITQQWPWRLNRLAMRSCFGGVKVDLLPYESGGDYFYNVALIDNIFAGSTRFWFTMYGSDAHPHTEIAGHAKFEVCTITGNQWRGTDPHPIKMLRWHPYGFNQYIANDPGSWEYTDNVGNCPLVIPPSMANEAGLWAAAETGPNSYKCHMCVNPQYMFVPYFHMVGGAIDYMRECRSNTGMVRMGEWIGGFPSVNSNYNFYTFGMLKMGQATPGDMTDEDLNNMFIVYIGVSIGAAPIADLSTGRTVWPEW